MSEDQKTAGQILHEAFSEGRQNRYPGELLYAWDEGPEPERAQRQERFSRAALAVVTHTIETARAARPIMVTPAPEEPGTLIVRPRFVIFVPVAVEKLVCVICGAEAFPIVHHADDTSKRNQQFLEGKSESGQGVLEVNGRTYPKGWKEGYRGMPSMNDRHDLCPDCAPLAEDAMTAALVQVKEDHGKKRGSA